MLPADRLAPIGDRVSANIMLINVNGKYVNDMLRVQLIFMLMSIKAYTRL